MTATRQDIRKLERRAIGLEVISITYNVAEGIIALTAGLVAGSIGLIGFGLDSGIEVSASIAILAFLSRRNHDDERAERRVATFVGLTLMALAVYVTAQATYDLVTRSEPEVSYVGIGLAAVSVTLMPLLARTTHDLAHKIESRALEAESRETLICGYLSATLLVGLGANALFGWWWADPVAALVMVVLIAHEGYEAFTRKDLCC